MNILSLFDGISCGQVALERAGIKVNNYFASEVDKYAIKITQKNYPETIHIGDVTQVKSEDLPQIDLLIGGSPCQGFSFAGKQLNFNDPRSALFFEYVRLLEELKPKYFLLENVKMKKEYQEVISGLLGVEPIEINSALVSAQNRKRLYWTNIPDVAQPEDKGLVLRDILETDVDKKYHILGGHLKWFLKNGEFQLKKKYSSLNADKAITMTARQYASWNGNFVTIDKPDRLGDINKGGHCDRVYSQHGKNVCLSALGGGRGAKTGLILDNHLNIRKLTPHIECCRLQTLPDGYTDYVSDAQAYKALGNGWTVDVIAHIMKGIV